LASSASTCWWTNRAGGWARPSFDDAAQLSGPLNFHLQQRSGNYRVSDDLVAYAGAAANERAAPLAIHALPFPL
jgi:hypothetical protein